MPQLEPKSQRDVEKKDSTQKSKKGGKTRPSKKKKNSIQGRLAKLKTKLDQAPAIAIVAPKKEVVPAPTLDQILSKVTSQKERVSEARKNAGPLAPIPFTNLGQWLIHAIHSVFGDQPATLRQLVAGMRDHVSRNRRAHNEHRKQLKLHPILEKTLPDHLFKLVNRMKQLFDFREQIYVRGTQQLSQYLTLMMSRAQNVSRELVAHETKMGQILKEWTRTLEQDRDVLVGRVRQSSDCANPASQAMFRMEPETTRRQLDHLLEQGKDLFDKIEELRKYRGEAIVAGNRSLAREIEKHLRNALSKAHAITGARQYFYTARESPDLLKFTTSTERLKKDLVGLLTLPKLYYNDYELAAKQFQSTIDENIGGMRLFATLKLRQEFLRAATELEEELCSQLDVLFRKIQSELKLLNEELEVLNTEFLAEFARARMDEDLREQTAHYIKALYVSSDCKMARLDEQFLTLVASSLKKSVKDARPIHIPTLGVTDAQLGPMKQGARKNAGKKGRDSNASKKVSPTEAEAPDLLSSDSDASQTASTSSSDSESDAESETSSRSVDSSLN